MSEKQISGARHGSKAFLPPSKDVREQLAVALTKVKFLRQVLRLSEAHERLSKRLQEGDAHA
jgi:hypothetical protein